MFIRHSHALLAALALITGPAFAQDTPAPTTPETPAAEAPAADAPAPAADAPAADAPATAPADAETPAAPADAPAAENAPAGQPARDPNGPGSYYAKSEHGDWTIRCIRADQGKDPCEMYKLLTDADDNPVAELTMVPLSNGDVAVRQGNHGQFGNRVVVGIGQQLVHLARILALIGADAADGPIAMLGLGIIAARSVRIARGLTRGRVFGRGGVGGRGWSLCIGRCGGRRVCGRCICGRCRRIGGGGLRRGRFGRGRRRGVLGKCGPGDQGEGGQQRVRMSDEHQSFFLLLNALRLI